MFIMPQHPTNGCCGHRELNITAISVHLPWVFRPFPRACDSVLAKKAMARPHFQATIFANRKYFEKATASGSCQHASVELGSMV